MGQGWLLASIAGIPAFVLYALAGTALLCIFGAIYVRLTRHSEIVLVRAGNTAAAIGFGSNLIGFAIPLSRSIQQASSIPDLIIWALLALAVQFTIYLLVQWLLLPDLSDRIERGEVSAGVTLGAASIAGGLINSASMSL